MPFVTILFLLANFAFFSILSSYDLRHVHSLSLHAGHAVLGQPGGFLMAGTVVASALGSINANLWAGSRLLVIMAKDNTIIPFPVARIWSRTGTQAIAILILVGQASFHSMINLDFKTFSKIYSAVGWTWYGLSVAGLLYLRKKLPHYPRPVKVLWPLATLFVVTAAVLVVGSLTLAFMSSAAQKMASSGDSSSGEDVNDEEQDGATGSGSDVDDGTRYVPIIMFGMVILFMLGVIPAYYLTKRYNQEHARKTTNVATTAATTVSLTTSESDDSESSTDWNKQMNDENPEGHTGEMTQIDKIEPKPRYQQHQTVITIDYVPFDCHPTDGSEIGVGVGTEELDGLYPNISKDHLPVRRHSAASSVTLVGESSRKCKNKRRRHSGKDIPKPSHLDHGQRKGEPSGSQSLDPTVLEHHHHRHHQQQYDVSEILETADDGEVVEENARAQALCRITTSMGSGRGGGGRGATRHTSLDHAELGISNNFTTLSPTANMSDSDSGNDSDDSRVNDSDLGSDSDPVDNSKEIDIDSARPESNHHHHFPRDAADSRTTTPSITTINRPSNLPYFFNPFDLSNPSTPSFSTSPPYSGSACMSPAMLTPFGSASQTVFNSPSTDSPPPAFAALATAITNHSDNRTFLPCGSNTTHSGSHSSETTLGLENDYYREQQRLHQQECRERDEEGVKGKGVRIRSRQLAGCSRVDEEEEEEGEEGEAAAAASEYREKEQERGQQPSPPPHITGHV